MLSSLILLISFPSKEIDSLIFEKFESEGATVALEIYDLKGDSIIYAHNANRRLPPASTMKVITTFVVQKYFSPETRFYTYFFRHSGDMIVFGGGDPSLDNYDLEEIAHNLYRKGIRRIDTLFYDDGFYSQDRYPYGWLWDDIEMTYAPPISPLVLNEGIIALHYRDTVKGNFHYMFIRTIDTTDTRYEVLGDTILVYGDFDRRKWFAFPQKNPEELFLWSLKNALYRDSIEVNAVGGYRKLPQDAYLVYSHPSPPVDSILRYMNRVSSNFTAEVLIRNLGAYAYGKGSWVNGLKAMKQILSMEGVDTNFLIVDGSGLSRYNMVSPSVFIQVFRAAYREPEFFNRFLSTLPSPGEGTLKKRFLKYRDHMRAKTGTLRGVASLAGVLDGRYAFSAIVYGFPGRHSTARKTLDSILDRAFSSLVEISPEEE